MEKKMGILITSIGGVSVAALAIGIIALTGARPILAEEVTSEMAPVSEPAPEGGEDSSYDFISYEDETTETPSESSSEKEDEGEQSSESKQDSSSESEEESDESSSEDVIDPEPEEKVYDSIEEILTIGQTYSSKTLLGHHKIMGYVVKKDATNVIVAADPNVENPIDVTTSLWVETNPEGYEVGDEVVFEGDVYAKARQNLRGTRTCTKMYVEEN